MEQISTLLDQIPQPALLVLVGLGALSLLRIALTLLGGLRFLFFSSGNIKRCGEWAVVTGATDGIGFEYARQLGKRGFNVVLISRSPEKLKQAEEEIKQTKVQVKSIAIDFSDSKSPIYEKIASELRGLDIGILVNNVGVSYPFAQYFDKIEDSLIDQLINVNIQSVTRMTRIVLPQMVQKKKGIIINVGSAAGAVPPGDPLYTVYSATKAYVDFFSRSLNLEYSSKGLIIENHIPYFVTSKLSKIRNASLTTPNPKTYVASALGKIGYSASVVPYWAHALQHWFMLNLPLFITSKIILSHHLDIHRRAMKKLEKQQ